MKGLGKQIKRLTFMKRDKETFSAFVANKVETKFGFKVIDISLGAVRMKRKKIWQCLNKDSILIPRTVLNSSLQET